MVTVRKSANRSSSWKLGAKSSGGRLGPAGVSIRQTGVSPMAKNRKSVGFSMIEVLVTLAILGVIAALALPQAINSLQAYRLHSTTSGLSGFFNIARMRAASQYRPYGFDINNTATPVSYVIEKLTQVAYNPLSPAAVTYASLSPQKW